jgi:hypothetical protein
MQMFNPGGVHPQKLEEQGIAYVQQNFPKLSTFKNCRAKIPAGGVPYPDLLQHFTLQAGVANVKLGMEGAYGLGGGTKHANANECAIACIAQPGCLAFTFQDGGSCVFSRADTWGPWEEEEGGLQTAGATSGIRSDVLLRKTAGKEL